MTVDLYDKSNSKIGTVELPDRIFKVKWNPDLVHQVLTAQLANRRAPLAHTKDRSEVRGGGRKPWRQKHTGRARHGSSRSPLWAGGGVTFGPRSDRKFSKKVNRKMKRLALCSVLSKKLSSGEVRIVDGLNLPEQKTKQVAAMLKRFSERAPSALLVAAKGNRNLVLASRNIPNVDAKRAASLNIHDCLSHRDILIEAASLPELATQPNV